MASRGNNNVGHGSGVVPTHSGSLTDGERQAIREQLGRILGSFNIRTSKKCTNFLRYVVEETLDGRAEALKERTLGSEVFHRGPLYDTNTDPVVRVTAGEVRKRLAQYYDQPKHQREIRIDLPRGSYVPVFHPPNSEVTAAIPVAPPSEASLDPAPDTPNRNVNPFPRQRGVSARTIGIGIMGIAFALFAGLLLGTFVVRPDTPRRSAAAAASALNQFWGPILGSPGNVWLCIGQVYADRVTLYPNGSINRFKKPYVLRTDTTTPHPLLVLADSVAMARVTGFLQSKSKGYTIKRVSETNLSDLTGGPSVLIGAFDNDWTMRLTDPLRFHFEMDPTTRAGWIADRKHPEKKIGTHIPGPSIASMKTAYAVISRVREPSTGQMVISIGGISTNGTLAAGRFVSSPKYLEKFAKNAPSDWASKNLQILLAADVVNGSLGEPRVLESYSW